MWPRSFSSYFVKTIQCTILNCTQNGSYVCLLHAEFIWKRSSDYKKLATPKRWATLLTPLCEVDEGRSSQCNLIILIDRMQNSQYIVSVRLENTSNSPTNSLRLNSQEASLALESPKRVSANAIAPSPQSIFVARWEKSYRLQGFFQESLLRVSFSDPSYFLMDK